MGGRRPSFNYSQIDPQIQEMYDDQGLSLNEIANRLGIYPMQVKRRLTAMGVEIRDRIEAVLLYHRLNKNSRRKAIGPKRVQSKKKVKKGKVRGSKKKAKKHTRRTEEANHGGAGQGGEKAVRPLRRRRFRRSKG